MKKILTAAAFAVLAASPALANSYSRHTMIEPQQRYVVSGEQAYAQAPAYDYGYGWEGSPGISYGQYVGVDPDPAVRLQLERGSVAFQ
jgi:hypothetical protein